MASLPTEKFEMATDLQTLPKSVQDPKAMAKKSQRIPALDFTKGALVLIMVLYHWLNYFFGTSDNRYLRFLTPSFIFITGFLISNVYFSKYGSADPRLPKRLMQRGLKILGVFLFLNLARVALFPGIYRAQMVAEHSSIRSLFDIYVVGSNLGGGQGKAIAFFILVPIAYLLLLSAVLSVAGRAHRHIFHAVCALFFLAIVILELNGYQSANLELLAIGLLGMVAGYIPIGRINAFLRYPFALVVAYLCYLGAITLWNIIYPLQVVGVCLSLIILYWMGGEGSHPNRFQRLAILLGKYSLLGYIAQIAVLQFLHQGLRHAHLSGIAALSISFPSAFILTILVVDVTDRARRRVATVDRFYRAVFA
jgi:peptidoglycan/LPS O-acetylase OafA/YrhL